MKIAVVCTRRIGDGLIYLVLAHNLAQQGHHVDYYSPPLNPLQAWFPALHLCSYEDEEQIGGLAPQYDVIYLCCDQLFEQIAVSAPFERLPNFSEKHWSKINQIQHFCQHTLGLAHASPHNGMTLPPGYHSRLNRQRVIIHPTSSDWNKDWLPDRFIAVAGCLQNRGYAPRFVVAPEEYALWVDRLTDRTWLPKFSNFHAATAFIAESGWMLGNDSGIGHLASNLGLPTLTIFRHPSRVTLWRPGWAPNRVITPRWSIKRFGLWKQFLTVQDVVQAFTALVEENRNA